ADEVMVMYAGKAVEYASVRELFRNPQHPYTRALLNSLPKRRKKNEPLQAIPGVVPQLFDLPHGCRFQNRCSYMEKACTMLEPDLRAVNSTAEGVHRSRCIKEFEGGYEER